MSNLFFIPEAVVTYAAYITVFLLCMNIQDAYNNWAPQYDSNENKTRDMEAAAVREILDDIHFNSCLEIGCGTGKNTQWLLTKATEVVSIDFSEEMLAKAKSKVASAKVAFIKADITKNWDFTNRQFQLCVFSLVLEHIENLDAIFEKTAQKLLPGGFIYVGELHPFKQYSGSKARYQTAGGEKELTCFTHHISDFTQSAAKYGLQLKLVKEYFDENNRNAIPRILALLFMKP